MDLFSHKHVVVVVKQYFGTLGDEETKINVSLKCRISKRRITISARGADCHHIEVQMMQLCQNLQVLPVYILRSTIYFYRAQFIVCVADGIYGGQVCMCVCGIFGFAEIPRRKLTSGRRGKPSAAFRYVF